jgi:hypothetical protein
MSGLRLSVDPAAQRPQSLGQVIATLEARPNAQAFLRRKSRSVLVTDNPRSPSLSRGNRNSIAQYGDELAGFSQEATTPYMVYINLDHWKPAINILVHELLHHATSGSGGVRHGIWFYRELRDVLRLLQIPYNSAQDLGGYSDADLDAHGRIALHQADAVLDAPGRMALRSGLPPWVPVAALGLSLVALATARSNQEDPTSLRVKYLRRV